MRLPGSVITLVLLAAAAPSDAAQPAIAMPGGGSVQVTQRGAATVVTVKRDGAAAQAVLPADDGIFARTLEETQLVGAIPGRVLILSTDYASRSNGGSHHCGAGIETVLRVIALAPRIHQTFQQLTASCWQTIEPGDVTWDGNTGMLTIERTTFDTGTQDLRTHYTVAPDGTVTPGEVEHLP